MTESNELYEDGAELGEEEMAAMPNEPSSEAEPAEVERDEIRDGA